MDKVTRQCPQTTTFLKTKESRSGIEPRSFRLAKPAHFMRRVLRRVFILRAESGRPEVTLCAELDVEIHLLTFRLVSQSARNVCA